MSLARYEAGRPGAAEALRAGDARVLEAGGWRGPEDFEAEIGRLLSQPARPR
jgi:hypothetical protein